MADNADRAQEVSVLMERAMLRRFEKVARRVVPGADCLACGEEIPSERRAVLPNCCLCFDCMDDAERAMGL